MQGRILLEMNWKGKFRRRIFGIKNLLRVSKKKKKCLGL